VRAPAARRRAAAAGVSGSARRARFAFSARAHRPARRAGYPNNQLVGKHPSWAAMRAQIAVSCKAIPLYTLLPPLSEHLILSGYTRCYGRLSSVGLPLYLCHVAVYMLCVEFGVYWQHRKLHEVKWAYQWLHRIHHIYNKEHTLSPFAGLAFHPLDGLLQAVPYVWTLFLVPCHYFTHEVLLFLTGVWTANIHDCIHGQCEPIMGAAYHTIHHTTYKHKCVRRPTLRRALP
jgi:lathosterol oxidase